MLRLHYTIILLLLPLANANHKLLQQRHLDESYPPFQLTKGRCKKPIQTALACANAVSKLGWQNTSALQIKELSWGPKGCFFLSTTNSLYFNTAAEAGSDDCSNLAKCGCEHCDDTCVKASGEVSTCNDTPDWTTSKQEKSLTCEQMTVIMFRQTGVPICKDKKIMFENIGNSSESESDWNAPEKNCCACGKGSDDWQGWGCTRDFAGDCWGSASNVVFLCLVWSCFCFCVCFELCSRRPVKDSEEWDSVNVMLGACFCVGIILCIVYVILLSI